MSGRKRWEDPFDKWFREFFEEISKRFSIPTPYELFDQIEREFEEFEKRGLKGPFIYGFSIKIGPDGKPIIKEFGNVKKHYGRPTIEEEREPLVDVFEDQRTITVIVEMPGVNKDDIKVKIDGDRLTVSAQTGDRKYYKEIVLPARVRREGAKASYKNGILELKLEKERGWKEEGYEIKIE
ncbi:MAG: Hsp20/alpha crystallin family protein [Candidatus Methanomethylicia archaeon]|nr:Hsp20/alpha crystallin family protein [Candidatus Methanomethylicia archaeon]MDW7988490.1 archaeal heat shock protein Hsp20 [Nitrososphaerota archaeon]